MKLLSVAMKKHVMPFYKHADIIWSVRLLMVPTQENVSKPFTEIVISSFMFSYLPPEGKEVSMGVWEIPRAAGTNRRGFLNGPMPVKEDTGGYLMLHCEKACKAWKACWEGTLQVRFTLPCKLIKPAINLSF
jgi:hypothetical protein